MKRPSLVSAVPLALVAGCWALLFAFGCLAANEPTGRESTVEVLDHRYTLDPTGTLDAAALVAHPERFMELPSWWHRDPPGVTRWERLDLHWSHDSSDGVDEPVLHLRTVIGNDVTVTYAPDDSRCGDVPPHVVRDSPTDLTVARWITLPICPGARRILLHWTTTRDSGPLIKVSQRAQASTLQFTGAANAYGVALFSFLGVFFGLAGVWRTRDPFWRGLLVRSLFLTPYFLQHASAPSNTPIGPLVQLISGVPADFLLAIMLLGHGVFLATLLWPQVRPGVARRWLLVTPTCATAGVLATLWAAYPIGLQLTMVTALLALPITLGVLLLGPGHAARNSTAERWMQVATVAVVVFGSVPVVLIHWPDYWRPMHYSILLFNISLAAWVALRASLRSTLAATALLREQLSRQRADDHAREQEERRLETRDLMLMLTHEIRTPLAVLQLSVDAAAKSAQAKHRVHEAIAEMDRLIERCMETARLDTETPEDAVGDWNAALAMQEIIAKSRAPERIRPHVDAAKDLRQTRPAVINAIVAILVDNALRYGAPAAPVDIDVAPTGTTGVDIVVSNAVGPLGAPDTERLFQKYYRGRGAHRQSGAGLGLYLASRLADRLGGRLSHATSADLTRFTLWIPP